LAVNAADKHYMSFIDHLMPLAQEQQLGIIGMKIPARSRILSSWTPPPSEDQRDWQRANQPGTLRMKDALEYVLSLPVSTVIIGCDDIAQLEENVQIARDFTPLSDEQLDTIAARTQEIHKQALFFRKWQA
jgi:aryl-alcohol dehydrogenase-like predicted oxidoreductase